MVSRCAHAPEILAGHENDFRIAKAVVKPKVAGAFHYLVTTFFYPPVRKERTTLLPSILRPNILAAKSEPGEHLLVYQTSTTNTALVDGLKASGLPCRVYGMRRDLKADEVEGNLTFKPFSETGFIDDLRTARGVVAGGGFTLMSEAVYLRKPMLSLPVVGQFEQEINALYLEQLGYGIYAKALDGDVLNEFLGRIPKCAKALEGYSQDGNVKMIAALDEVLARAYERKGTWAEITNA
jgi:uncharacterized protein (TIGR00661 family)